MRKTYALLALAALTAACGGDSESGFAGDYQTVSIESRATCAGAYTTEAIPAEQEYFRLADESIFGVSMVGWHTCTAVGACSSDMSLLSSFAEESGAWRNDIYTWSYGGGTCSMGATLQSLERVDATTIRVRSESRSVEDTTLTEAECDDTTVKARLASAPCESDGQLTATLLQ